ncbi:MAG: apolipoprotein N-acyltransferase [Phycisphaerales bacterium]
MAEPNPIPSWQAFLAGLAHAACMVLAFPPFSWWGCALVAVAPLVWLGERVGQRMAQSPTRERRVRATASAGTTEDQGKNGPDARASGSARVDARRARRRRADAFRPAVFAGVGTLPFWAFEHRWIWDVSAAGTPILLFLLVLFPIAFVWALARLARRLGPIAPFVPTFLVAGLLWGGLEFFRGTLAFDGYPWYYVGHPLIDSWFLAAPAAVVGAFGVSVIAAMSGSLLGWLAARLTPARAVGFVASGLALTLITWLLGVGRLFEGDLDARGGRDVRVGVVQTNIPQSVKGEWSPAQRLYDLRAFLDMSWGLALNGEINGAAPPDVIVWPETMFPGISLDDQARAAEEAVGLQWRVAYPSGPTESVPTWAPAETLLEQQREIGVPMLVGATGFENVRWFTDEEGAWDREVDAIHNSVFSIEGGRVTGRYDKLHLTPFGEVMPYISNWAWLERQLLAIGASGMAPLDRRGRGARVVSVGLGPANSGSDAGNNSESQPGASQTEAPAESAEPPGPRLFVAAPICFESTNPSVCRALVEEARREAGPDDSVLLVNPTNDGWFGPNDAGRVQHLQLARWRAVELGVGVVRAANTGVSCAIDHQGRVVAVGVRGPDGTIGEARAEGVLIAELRLPRGRTVFAGTGDRLGWIVMAVGGLLLVAAFVPWPRGRGREPEPSEGTERQTEPPPDRR